MNEWIADADAHADADADADVERLNECMHEWMNE